MADPENIASSLMPPISHNPDVLSCPANLSNDEVFTSPNVANAMLGMLPQELFKNPSAKFLDPVCKSGVFLREITKRLMLGLEKEFPDQQKRLDHILHNQVYGLAITELTSLLSRRTLYCAKYATSPYSISKFGNIDGNIRFKSINHTFDKNGKCIFCGASQSQYERGEGLETHAYEFIRVDNPQEIFGDMKFDVIIGNPPYQLSDGGDEKARKRGGAVPIYQYFIEQAKNLNPNFLIMITPSRWFAGGRGLDNFRDTMLHDTHIKVLTDYPISKECFNGVEIKGGVSYFLWDRSYSGLCRVNSIRNGKKSSYDRLLLEDNQSIFIRYNEAIPIFRKIFNKSNKKFNTVVSTQKPFGFRTYFEGKNQKFNNSVMLYGNKKISFVERCEIKQHLDWVDKYKIYITMAYGAGEDFPHQIINKPFLGGKNSCCTETYLVIGPYDNEEIAKNVLSYMTTKFFRFLVLLRKNTQHASSSVYSFVPLQDFSKPWTDADLYAKYNLTQEEIDFIESMIKPMDISPEVNTEPENA